MLSSWETLPEFLQNDRVLPYYEVLQKKKISLFFKRIFDIVGASFLLFLLWPVLLSVALIIKFESKGDVLFKQIRITAYGKQFYIYKFRTMVANAELMGTNLTVKNDSRITKTGAFLRKYRIDEFPQLFNILKGEMSFVGTRPEVTKYVEHYTDEMYATLLLPAGVTSIASVDFRNEEELLHGASDPESKYISEVLPQKMKLNLQYVKSFSIISDVLIIIKTIRTVFIG
jgi:lipopolysaccharide/colanic/teichoic acid biosynthesis glycosyltransferase